jgi:hypothetical protein
MQGGREEEERENEPRRQLLERKVEEKGCELRFA